MGGSDKGITWTRTPVVEEVLVGSKHLCQNKWEVRNPKTEAIEPRDCGHPKDKHILNVSLQRRTACFERDCGCLMWQRKAGEPETPERPEAPKPPPLRTAEFRLEDRVEEEVQRRLKALEQTKSGPAPQKEDTMAKMTPQESGRLAARARWEKWRRERQGQENPVARRSPTNQKPARGLFGKALRTARLQTGLTARELSEKLGFSTSFVGILERGQAKPSTNTFETLEKEIARILGRRVELPRPRHMKTYSNYNGMPAVEVGKTGAGKTHYVANDKAATAQGPVNKDLVRLFLDLNLNGPEMATAIGVALELSEKEASKFLALIEVLRFGRK